MEITATWVGEGESEFFNRWLVVGVPRGAAVGVTGAAYALHHSGGFRGGVTGCVGTERCSVKVNYSSHIPNLSPPSLPPTRLLAPTREVRSLCPTPCPLSSCATFHSHLPPRLISLPLCFSPEDRFNSDSINPRCDFVLYPDT